ncbi:uncharacterized protein LOC62_07G009498 [Vanrija pseudolonga]|uniref:Uncharacterized protein n=1 Tax=Vanrija pseudolonga TaxID=143232 RepID=A0AAF1BQA7_9TREE|nr:hypothetical protein LOC62_07G009498 [Vanrija pseudolonga]
MDAYVPYHLLSEADASFVKEYQQSQRPRIGYIVVALRKAPDHPVVVMPADDRCELCASDLDLPCVVDLSDVLETDKPTKSVKCAACSSNAVSKCRVVSHMTREELLALAAADNSADIEAAWEKMRDAKTRLGIGQFYEWTRGLKGRAAAVGATSKGSPAPPVHSSDASPGGELAYQPGGNAAKGWATKPPESGPSNHGRCNPYDGSNDYGELDDKEDPDHEDRKVHYDADDEDDYSPPTALAQADHQGFSGPVTEERAQSQILPLTQVAILSLGESCDDPWYLVETAASIAPGYQLSFAPHRDDRFLRPPYTVPMFERSTFISAQLLDLMASAQRVPRGGRLTLPHYLYRARLPCSPCHALDPDTECYIHDLVMDPGKEGEDRPRCLQCIAGGKQCGWDRVWCNDGKNGADTPPPDPMGVVVVMRWDDRSNVVDKNVGRRIL